MARIQTGGGGFVSINDDDRGDYVSNVQGLYTDYLRSRLSLREYVRRHRDEIDAVISELLNREPG